MSSCGAGGIEECVFCHRTSYLLGYNCVTDAINDLLGIFQAHISDGGDVGDVGADCRFPTCVFQNP